MRTNYGRLTEKLDHRFGRKDPPASIRRQLSSLKQKPEESLEEFAERAQKLALDSFPDVHGEATDILRTIAMEAFLKGCTHQRAALQVLNKEPEDIEDALHLMKIHVQNYDILFGKKTVKQVSFAEDSEDEEFMVRAISSENEKQKPWEERLATLIEKPIAAALRTGIEEGMKSMANIMKTVFEAAGKRDSSSSPKKGERPATPPRERTGCFKCGDTSHFARECPKSSPRSPGSPNQKNLSPKRNQPLNK